MVHGKIKKLENQKLLGLYGWKLSTALYGCSGKNHQGIEIKCMKTRKLTHKLRYAPCGCGHCGMLLDNKLGVVVANFVGPEDRELPISEKQRQAYMRLAARSLNQNEISPLTT